MKKIIQHIALFSVLLSLLAVSCNKTLNGEEPVSQDGGRLRFTCVEPVTRAGISGTDPGVEALKENLLASIDVYFYPNNLTGDNAVYHKRMEPGTAQITYATDIDFTQGQIRTLFNGSTSCHVYAIANIEASKLPADLSGTSLPELKAITISSTFGSTAGSSHTQASFVMDGFSTLTLTSLTQTTVATGEVDMYRIAAKLSLLVHVHDSIHLATTYKDEYNNEYLAYEIWRPMADKDPATGNSRVEAYLENGCSATQIGARLEPDVYTPNADAASLFKYSKNRMKYDAGTTLIEQEAARYTYSDFKAGLCTIQQVGTTTGSTVNVKYMYSDPAYTYPLKWTEGAQNEPFYKLVLPWKRSDTLIVRNNNVDTVVPAGTVSAQKQYYYKIVFPNADFKSNNHYRYKLNVGILGSETDDSSVLMTPTYMVAGWQNKSEVLEEAEVGNARYLSVAQSAYTMYNEEDLKIPFISSDDCEIVDATWQQPYFGTANSGYTTINGKKYKTGSASGWLSITSGNTIRFQHSLDNVMSTSMDVAPYTVTFTIRHKDDYDFNKQVTIIQYPAIYIDQFDGGDVFIDGYFGHVTIDGTAYKSVNYSTYNNNSFVMTPYRSVSTSLSNLGSITRVSVSVFDSSSNTFKSHDNNAAEYIIGDPRQNSGWSSNDLIAYGVRTNLNTRGCSVTATNWGDKAAQIKIGTTNPQIIAPSILIASFWCGMSTSDELSFDYAKKRCATYQEAGYPAGRWRLPTEAEVNYIQRLQTNNHIATLFNASYYYWTSSGHAYKGSDNSYKNTGTDSGARCVYDVWYWGETAMSRDTYHPNP